MLYSKDLSGRWDFSFDRIYSDVITLPTTTSEAKKGRLNTKAETGCLTDTYAYEGEAWFRRSVHLDKCDGAAFLYLERTRITCLYIDGKPFGSCDSLCTPHIYDITSMCDGSTKPHTVELCVKNIGYKTAGGHMTSCDTQTNWLGITGKIEIRYRGAVHAERTVIDSDLESKSFIVSGKLSGSCCGCVVRVTAEADGFEKTVNADIDGGSFHAVLSVDDPRLWSDLSPSLYKITVDVSGDRETYTAGMRKLTCSGSKFLINGAPTFLRGKHDGMLFPKTGYAPTDTESWLGVMGTAKEYGINHYRFHTCCPPEAAFEAADILGIYMEPELPFWGTVAAEDQEGFNGEEQEYLLSEGLKILRTFGNHPSFCMLSMGNELWGSRERINGLMSILKRYDSRPLYTQGSNCFQFYPDTVPSDDFFVGVRLSESRLIRGSYAACDAPLGHVQTDAPSTLMDYDQAISGCFTDPGTAVCDENGYINIQYGTGVRKVRAAEAVKGFTPNIPIITHEIGQYETYPNYGEIKEYTGSIKPRNLEIFRKRLCDKGLGELADKYFRASGALAVSCYKEELEAVLRSRLLAGCQILDIQDFSGQGTALVGVLDAFMKSKGLITAEEWREFFSETVILARFDKYVYSSGERFTAKLQLTDFGAESFAGKKLCWRLGDRSGELTIPEYENYCDIGAIETNVCGKCGKLCLYLEIEGTSVKNHYDLDIIKNVTAVDTRGCVITSAVDAKAQAALRNGQTVLLFRTPDEDKSIEGFYCTDFWCYPMFRSISESVGKPAPVGTMGLLIDSRHPSLSGFSCESHSTPQWYRIVSCSRSEIIDGCQEGKQVIVRTIDNFERNHSLALVYEQSLFGGRLIVCGAEFEKLSAFPEGRAFCQSLIDYAYSSNQNI